MAKGYADGQFFPLCEPMIQGPATRVMSLRDGTKKMSKSDPSDLSRINLTDDADTIARKIQKAKTDTEPLPSEAAGLKGRPEADNLTGIYAALAGTTQDAVLEEYGGGQFSAFKRALSDLAVARLAPITSEMTRPAELQTRLLRVLADGEFYPVGAYASVKVDVRIIAATHQNLETLVAQGRFREDLFHRLNVIRIHIPPLRERSQDIPLLMQHFLSVAASELNTEIKILTPDAENFLSTLTWPGNVRQLENTCRWLTVMAPGREIHRNELPPELIETISEKKSATTLNWENLLRANIDQQLIKQNPEIAKHIINQVETILIQAALNYTQGKKHEAANMLGYGRNTLTRKIFELNIE